MTKPQPVRWMCLCESPGDAPPRQIPAGAVWIRLDGGNPAPAIPSAETDEQEGDDLNRWPSSAPPMAKIQPPDYLAAVAARRGNTHAPD